MDHEQRRLTMRCLPVDDRPCEKLLASGPQALTDAELMAIIIRSGSQQDTALSLCQRLLADDQNGNGLAVLQDKSLEELMCFPGIGQVKAAQLKAALEIGSRAYCSNSHQKRVMIRSPQDAINLLEREMCQLSREELRIVLLDTRNRVLRICRIAEGGLAAAVIHPRDLFREAIRANAAALILAHNHPSGNSAPSHDDLDTTRRLVEAGDMMGVKVVDHIILAFGGSTSFRQNGLI